MAGIGVSLSGGGYRASLFGLGVLLYLADAGKNADVSSITSVSGGSITNGFVGQTGGFPARTGAEFREDVRTLVRTIAHQTLWSSPRVWIYLLFLVASLPALVWVAFFLVPWAPWVRITLFVVLLGAWGWLLQQRGVLAGRAFASKLFTPGRKPTLLRDIETELDHVICATHLEGGEHLYFSGRWVYAWRLGWGVPGDLPLHVAVQASAAFPGGFPPRWLSTARFHFQGGQGHPGGTPRRVTLADGGVYDNMADEWPSGVARRAEVRPDLDLKVPDTLIVVNSSLGLRWSSVSRLRIPLLGEFLALTRDIDVMYDNSASLRMRGLVHRFESDGDVRGVLVTLEQSPCRIPRAFEHDHDPARRARAEAALRKLGDAGEWDRITEADMSVATTLSKMGAEVSGRLLRHGYATAMANLHVILDYPLLDVPDAQTFEALAG